MVQARKGACPVCGKELSITARGGVRIHGYARGGGDSTERCPGSSQPPASELSEVPCVRCAGIEPSVQSCNMCGGYGKTPVNVAMEFDAVLLAERTLSEMPPLAASSVEAAHVVQTLLKYGFIEDAEEAPNPQGTGPARKNPPQANEHDATVFVALMGFFETWKKNNRGPMKPEVLEASREVDEVLAKWREERTGSDG